ADGLNLSPEHSDQSSGMGDFHRQFHIPVPVTEKTLVAARRHRKLGAIEGIRHFEQGARLQFGEVTVETIPTPHDGVDGVAFVVDDGQQRLGILTDLGHVFEGLKDVIASLDAVILESNYDPVMLSRGTYPEAIKQRIRGAGGHLSNRECAELLDRAATGRLKWICLAHLSGENNTPEKSLGAHREVLGARYELLVAGRDATTDVLEI
ncbi:MAG: MBL fold metallo-hydrolase, partial [Planctomycetaceae bacterium]